jgi:hypothetical protein
MSTLHFGRSFPPHTREAVAWFQPDVLWTSGREVVSSLDQLRNRDLREGYELPLTVIDRSDAAGSAGEFWFDFIADTGDGGNATYAVAQAVSKDSVAGADGQPLPRGELLLFGGDLAYPSASADAYRYRFIEMFEGARHDMGVSRSMVRGRPLTLAALAQNHDWMDSANTFNRYFIRNKESTPFLGASIPQKQSYFCVKLPAGWWVLGFDFALMGDIDRGQFEQFERLLDKGIDNTIDGVTTTHKIGSTDRVIVIYPEPYWTRPIGDGAPPTQPKRYQRLEGLLGERIALRLAGDLHHYMRWESLGHGRIVTCGTGGAFAHPTHTYATTRPVALRRLNNRDAVPLESAPAAVAVGLGDLRRADGHFTRVEKSVYPDAATSRSRSIENLWALFKKNKTDWGGNWLFAVFMGGLYWFNAYLNSMPFTESFKPDGFLPLSAYAPAAYASAFLMWLKAMTFSPLGFVINVVMAVACMLMGREAVNELSPRTSRAWRWVVTWGLGLGHAFLHVVAVFSLTFWLQQAVGHLPVIGHPGPSDAMAAVGHSAAVGVGLLIGGAAVGAFIFGCYLTLMSWLGFLTNNGYSALGVEDYKGFLRFRVTPSGRLDAYFIAIDRVPRKWTVAQGGQWPAWVKADAQATPERVHDHFFVPPATP